MMIDHFHRLEQSIGNPKEKKRDLFDEREKEIFMDLVLIREDSMRNAMKVKEQRG